MEVLGRKHTIRRVFSSHDEQKQIYLKLKWIASPICHPFARIGVILLKISLYLWLHATSPMIFSFQKPSYFPVYSSFMSLFLFSNKLNLTQLIFHWVLLIFLYLVLRYVLYPQSVQQTWNWTKKYQQAIEIYTRNTGAFGMKQLLSRQKEDQEILLLHSFPSKSFNKPIVMEILNDGTSKGSWTFVWMFLPITWACLVQILRDLLSLTMMDVSFPTKSQFELQNAVYDWMMYTSCLSLFVLMDMLLQDQSVCKRVYRNWWFKIRQIYVKYQFVRILSMWTCMSLLSIGTFYLHMFTQIRTFMGFAIGFNQKQNEFFYLNESWRCLLTGLIVTLDLLIVVQDWTFPLFTTCQQIRLPGLLQNQIKLSRFTCIKPVVLTAKWTFYFIVLVLMIPFDICSFLQEMTYRPQAYGQFINTTNYEIFPLHNDFTDKLLTQKQIQWISFGASSRFFEWPLIEVAPASIGAILLGICMVVWLWRKQYPKLYYSIFLGVNKNSSTNTATSPRMMGVPPRFYEWEQLKQKLSKTTQECLYKQSKRRHLLTRRCRVDNICIWLVFVSICLCFLQLNSIYETPSLIVSSSSLSSSWMFSHPGQTCSFFLTLVTLLLVHQLVTRYLLKRQMMILQNVLPSKSSLWSTRTLYGPFLLELFVNCLFLPPFLHGTLDIQEYRYHDTISVNNSTCLVPFGSTTTSTTTGTTRNTTSDPLVSLDPEIPERCFLVYQYPIEIFQMIVLLRSYWFIRIMRNMSHYRTQQALLAGALNKIPMDSLLWHFRLLFRNKPSQLIVPGFLVLWLLTSLSVSIFERPLVLSSTSSTTDEIGDYLWLTIVTMSSVGYGDMYPKTLMGRVVIFLGAVFGGTLLISFMMSLFLDALKGSKEENRFVSIVNQTKWLQKKRHLSSQLIAIAWKRYRATGANRSSLNAQVFALAHAFKALRKNHPLQQGGGGSGGGGGGTEEEEFFVGHLYHWKTTNVLGIIDEMDRVSQRTIQSLQQQVDTLEDKLRPLLNN